MTKEEADKFFNNLIDALKGAGASMRCNELTDVLNKLYFEVRDGSKGGHKLYRHRAIPDFHGGSFNCGHGKNSEVKPVYIKKIIRVLNDFSDEIKQYLQNAKP